MPPPRSSSEGEDPADPVDGQAAGGAGEPRGEALPDPSRSRWGIVRHALLLPNLGFPPAAALAGFPAWMLWAEAMLVAPLVFAMVSPRCQWLGPVVTRFRPESRDLWLTIDDGPFGESSARLAEALRDRGVPATFFYVGERLARAGEVARRVLECGHGIGNHTFRHPAAWFTWLPPSALAAEIDRCSDAIRSVSGSPPRLFRSPVGLKHPWLHRVLPRRGLRMIAWSLRGRDGLRCEPGEVTRRIVGRAKPGDILLLHEGLPKSEEAILSVTDRLLADGFRFVIPGEGQLR